MKYFKSFTVALLIIFTVTSCSLENGIIQKRRYQKGYYISIAHNKKANGFINKSSDIDLIKENNNHNKIIEQEIKLSQFKELKQIENRNSLQANESELKDEKAFYKEKISSYKNKEIVNKFKKLRSVSQEVTNNTSSKPVSKSSDNIINLILAIALVVTIIMLLSFIDGLLGGLLSLILLIVIIVLLLSYFGIV